MKSFFSQKKKCAILAAQAAGYNVNVSRNIFLKYYMAWTAFMPTVYNSSDGSIYNVMDSDKDFDLYARKILWQPVYDQGGHKARSVGSSASLRRG